MKYLIVALLLVGCGSDSTFLIENEHVKIEGVAANETEALQLEAATRLALKL